MTERMNSPVFTRHQDNTVTVDVFTPELVITGQLLRDAAAGILVRVGFRTIEFRCENGRQRYRLAHIARRWGPREVDFLCKVVLDDQQRDLGRGLDSGPSASANDSAGA